MTLIEGSAAEDNRFPAVLAGEYLIGALRFLDADNASVEDKLKQILKDCSSVESGQTWACMELSVVFRMLYNSLYVRHRLCKLPRLSPGASRASPTNLLPGLHVPNGEGPRIAPSSALV